MDLQKASVTKRISAAIFDAILLSVLAVGVAFLISWLTGYDTYNDKLQACYTKYEEKFNVTFDITLDKYEALTADEKQNYDDAYAALAADGETGYNYTMVVNLTLLIISLSALTSCMVLEFTVPRLFGNGQTLGKKIFGLGLMRTDGVKIGTVSLLVRTVLGKYTIEIMVPALIMIMIYFNTIGVTGTAVLILLLLLQVILIIVTKTNSPIHDLLAGTVAVDLSSQLIFENEEKMLEYKKKKHAEAAEKSAY